MRASVFSFSCVVLLVLATAMPARAAVELSAECGSGTPSMFAPGVSASDRDGSIYYVDWANGNLSYKLARDLPLVTRWRETLERIGFAQIRYDHWGKPWCGIVWSADGVRHAVRWPTAVSDSGSLEHRFEGMPAEVWFVYLEMQQVAVNGEVCAEVGGESEYTGSIALQCAASGDELSRAEIRILPDGDLLLSRLEPTPGRRCATVIGSHPGALQHWHASLDEAEFEELPDHAAAFPNVGCTIERTRDDVTHRVRLGPARPADSRWKVVDPVASELAVMAGGRLRFNASGPGSEVEKVTLLDAFTARAIASADVLVASDNGIRCEIAPCPTERVEWRGRTDTSGRVLLPTRFVTEMTVVGTPAHQTRSIDDATKGADGALALELIPRELPSDGVLGLGLTPLKLVDAQSGAAVANEMVHVAAEGTVGLVLTSNALGYVFIDAEDFGVLLEEVRVSIPGYRRRELGFDLVVPFERERAR
jgi:hypothetical protein